MKKLSSELDPEFEYKDDPSVLRSILILSAVIVFTVTMVVTGILMVFARNGFFDSI